MTYSIPKSLKMPETCPLCQNIHTRAFYRSERRDYFRCQNCALIFVSRSDLLSSKDEKARYDLHENDPADPGYRSFLRQLIRPLTQKLEGPPLNGLDFGSGPGPALAMMLEAQGYKMTLYDPYYAPRPQALSKTYDFVTCTEAIEHFYNPGQDWELLLSLVKPGGWLGIMTKLMDDLESFPNMHYIKDATHVSFFSRQTFRYLAKCDGLSVEFIGDNVILLQKPESVRRDNDG